MRRLSRTLFQQNHSAHRQNKIPCNKITSTPLCSWYKETKSCLIPCLQFQGTIPIRIGVGKECLKKVLSHLGSMGFFCFFGVSVFFNSKLWPEMEVASTQGASAPAVLLQERNPSGIWHRLSWGLCSQAICSDLISYTALSLS